MQKNNNKAFTITNQPDQVLRNFSFQIQSLFFKIMKI